jgi:DNA-binding beta-propeller fold protein YncE
MAERAIPLTQPTRTDRPNRRVSFPEAITALAIVAALLTVGARVTGRLPNERAAAIADQPTRLIQMGGVWAQPATNPQRDRIFHILDPATGTETGETLPFHLPENAEPLAFSGDGRTLAYTVNPPSHVIFVVDVAIGTVRRTLTFDQPTFVMQLNRDGTRLMLYRFNTPNHPPEILLTIDVASGATLATVTLPSSSGDAGPIITPDLRTAYVLDTHTSGTWPNLASGAVTLDVIDTTTGTRQIVLLPFIQAGYFPENRTIQGEPVLRWIAPALVPSPDNARLFIVSADSDAITVINRREARVEHTESIHPPATATQRLFGWLTPMHVAAKEAIESIIKRASISPGGETLAITGMTIHPLESGGYDGADLGVQFVDLRTFTEQGQIAPLDRAVSSFDPSIQFSADGHLLYVGTAMAAPSDGTDNPYQLRVVDARSHRVIASRTTVADADTPVYLLVNWFALPQ